MKIEVDKEHYDTLVRLDKNLRKTINENKEFLEWESIKQNLYHRVLIENRIRDLEAFYEMD